MKDYCKIKGKYLITKDGEPFLEIVGAMDDVYSALFGLRFRDGQPCDCRDTYDCKCLEENKEDVA